MMKKVGLLGFTGLVLAWILVAATRPDPVPKDVMIDNAIAYYLGRQSDTASQSNAQGEWFTVKYKTFESKEELLEYFPDCCRYSLRGTEGDRPSFWDRWRYDFAGIVIIRAGYRQITPKGEKLIHTYGATEVHMTSTGEVIPQLPRRSNRRLF